MKRDLMVPYLLLLSLLVPASTLAQGLAYVEPEPQVSVVSLDRVAVGAGLNYAWTAQAGEEPVSPYKHEWEVTANAAYVLTPHVTTTMHLAYGVDNKFLRWKPEARLRLTEKGAPISFQVGLGYAFYDAHGTYDPPAWGKEWEVGAYAGKGFPIAKQAAVIFGASVCYGFDNQRIRSGLDARLGYTFNHRGY